MYSQSSYRGAKHEWLPSIDSVGTPSYINIQVFRPFANNIYSSLSCPTLHCSTFLRIPGTHILFSLASCTNIMRQKISSANGHPVSLITLCQFSIGILDKLRVRTELVSTLIIDAGPGSGGRIIQEGCERGAGCC